MTTLNTVWAAGCMKQVCDIFDPVVDPNTDGGGTPGDRGWILVQRGVPRWHVSTRNFSEVSVMGRTLEPSSISTEFAYFLPDAPIKESQVFRDTTPGGLLNGNCYRILGAPTKFDGIPVDDAAYQEVEVRQEPHAPAGLPA